MYNIVQNGTLMSTLSEDPRTTRTREAVIAGTRAVIARQGVNGLTYDAVAEASRVSRTTLYKYWPTIDELVKEALHELTQPPFPMTATDDVVADLMFMFGRLIAALDWTFTGSAIAALIDSAERNESFAALLTSTVEDRRSPAVKRIRHQQSEQRPKHAPSRSRSSPDADVLHDLVAGAIYYRRYVRRVPTTEKDLAQMVQTIAPHITNS
jgi:AcrR family transcriptional regulator